MTPPQNQTVRLPDALPAAAVSPREIPLQVASRDIWDKKYRLKKKNGTVLDQSIEDTYRRVARALAGVEATPEQREAWYEKFVWALRHGAIPAGRIISNAGALEHKPATSTINCTVSGTIRDSMNDILQKVHEAGLTLKAGCVAPGTDVVTEHGLVKVERAVTERHQRILCYDRAAQRFEMRRIQCHLTTHVPQAENIEIISAGASLRTSARHPVLVYRDGRLIYVPADAVQPDDALVHYHFPWSASPERTLDAWFTGAHLGDGSAYERKMSYKPTRAAWTERARLYGKRFVLKIRAAERGVVERYAHFFRTFCNSRAKVVAAQTVNGFPVWDYTVSSFEASKAVDLIDHQTGRKSAELCVPEWIATRPDRYFLPFLAGLIDTDGTVSTHRGSAILSTSCWKFAEQLKGLLALFGVHAALTKRRPRTHEYRGRPLQEHGGTMLKISDSAFLARVADYMADSGKRNRIRRHASAAGQYDQSVLPGTLSEALERESTQVGHSERQRLGFYHGYHQARVISRIWLDRWAERFPHLRHLIDFARTLRPIDEVRRGLDLPETFYDFTVEQHNNYLAGNCGLAVIHNCGIGYEFSTLRPKGAYVSGAGAYTSGPLSFMDIYDKMCFTVSSAGGRRGAQMATFHVGHPDVEDFVRAKRENGRLRQFNLSLLISREFMETLKNDGEWKLAFPLMEREAEVDGIDLSDPQAIVWRAWPVKDGYIVNDKGQVACKVYRTIKARQMWNLIMTSTYDFAEPGLILIDEVNELNNNWFCENIRASNPCVTADTWVHTSLGSREVRDLVGRAFEARVGGKDYATGPEGFFATGRKPVLRLTTAQGYALRLTEGHPVRVVRRKTPFAVESEWRPAGDIRAGDEVVLHDHRDGHDWDGSLTAGEGYLMGLLLGDGCLNGRWAALSVWRAAAAANAAQPDGAEAVMSRAERALRERFDTRSDFAGWHTVKGRNEHRVHSVGLMRLAERLGVTQGNKHVTPAIEAASSAFYRGFLRGLFDTDGSVQGTQTKGVSVRLSQSDRGDLQAVQRMLLRLGIASTLYARRPAGEPAMPDGRGGERIYPCRAQYELVIAGDNLVRFERLVGFEDTRKAAQLQALTAQYRRRPNRERFTARVESVVPDGEETVYDVRVPGPNAFDANGLYVHNCGEQMLPPYGSCLLGSVNLTKFVLDPFTDRARFDWDNYRKTVAIFTRMLDNVVEINGLPLEKQREEILRKRRHGMGYLGLGSTLAMLCMRYGSEDSLRFTEQVSREMAIEGWRAALELATEKGPAPIMEEEFEVTEPMLQHRPEMAADGYQVGDKVKGKVLHARYSRYMQRIAEAEPELVAELAEAGARFTHHTSIAPTGTISLSLANNASNGIEPSFAHHYSRNVIREGRKSKEKVDVFSFELLAYRELVNPKASPRSEDPDEQLPEYFVTADDITPKEHIDVQAAAQKWVDSSISKTANVPTDYSFQDFKDIYLYAYEQGLKGCTTFRFNPEAFQGVLVKEKDLESTVYCFTLKDGSVVEAKGNEEVEYDGEVHTAANLYDAIKEGYYGKF